jgi:seryl-tRNA synthetase
MIDIKKIRDNIELIENSLKRKDKTISLSKILEMDQELRSLTSELNVLQSEQNQISKEIGRMKSQGGVDDKLFTSLKSLSSNIKDLETQSKNLSKKIRDKMLLIPNPPHDSVPFGTTADNNVVTRNHGERKKFDFNLKDHVQICNDLSLVDFEGGVKISGGGFPLMKGNGALLERALINFMIDYHLKNYNYTEYLTPFLVNPSSAITTSQLPKFSEDMYYIEKDDLYLIPTAEVSITNIHRDEILDINDLPKYYLGYSACFRREAGSYGKDTRGLLRVHQFSKVELVKFVEPNNSYQELENLVVQASKILELLELEYRVVELCSGDLSFAAAKCYDLEVWAPTEESWLEVSSCSNFEDFQARRGNIRFKGQDGKVEFVHTLNGSGLAIPRIFAALLETHQNKDGSINIPAALQPYMGISKLDC